MSNHDASWKYLRHSKPNREWRRLVQNVANTSPMKYPEDEVYGW